MHEKTCVIPIITYFYSGALIEYDKFITLFLQVKVAFQTTSDLLSEIASDYLNNEDDLSGAGRKIELKDNLVVEFNNKAPQVNPTFRMLVLAHYYSKDQIYCLR